MTEHTYESSGVHNWAKEEVSRILYAAARETWENRKGRIGEVISPFDDFSGIRGIDVGGLPKGTFMGLGFDGVGTKMEIGERIGKHDTIAYDLFAMVCDDKVVRGEEPVLIGSVLDVNTLVGADGKEFREFVTQLATGYRGAAKASRTAVINGEVAEIGARVSGYGPFNYNWSAGCIGFARKDRMLTGKDIAAKQSIVALQEYGFRSNGLSLVRKVLKSVRGDDWHAGEDGRKYAEKVLRPSTIYCAAIVDMLGGFDGEPQAPVTGVIHVTGGGIPEKAKRALRPAGLGAVLDNLFEPPQIMREVQELGNVALDKAYNTWNMGNGMLVITPKPFEVIEVARRHGLEAKIAGEVRPEEGIRIKTYTGKWLN